MINLLNISQNRRFPLHDNGKFIPRYGGAQGGGELQQANGNLNQLLESTRPQTTGDVPRISVTQAVQNSLRK